MKKLTIIFLALFMVLSLGACAGNSQSSKDHTSDTVIDADAGAGERAGGTNVLVAYFSGLSDLVGKRADDYPDFFGIL